MLTFYMKILNDTESQIEICFKEKKNKLVLKLLHVVATKEVMKAFVYKSM